MKKYFITGMAILLPLALTIAIVVFLVNLLTTPFIGIVKPILSMLHLFQEGFLFFTADEVLTLVSQGLILVFLFLFTIMLGMLTQWVLVSYFLKVGDYILHRIPLINTVYKTSQDVIKTIFSHDSRSFTQVALVPFPSKELLSIGLVTCEAIPGMEESGLVAVFVPTAPNPTSGYLVLFKKDQVTILDMAVETAFKYIISCGTLSIPIIPKNKGS